MKQADLLSSLLWLVSALGGIGVILLGISGFISRLLQQKFIYHLQKINNKDIEQFKSIIAQNNTFISSLNSNHSAVYQKLQAKRLEVVELYWECILKSKDAVPNVANLIYRVLTDEEITVPSLRKSRWGTELASTSYSDAVRSIAQPAVDIDFKKPFISNRLWTLKYAHGTILGRSTYLLLNGYQNTGNIILWKKDSMLKQAISLALTEEEIKTAVSLEIGSIKYILDLIENKMVDEIQRFISNDDFISDSAEQFKKITSLMGNSWSSFSDPN